MQKNDSPTITEGAPVIDYSSVLCEIVTATKTYKIRALVKGCKMLEFNENISVDLLVNKPESEGFLAILMFKETHDVTSEQLLSNVFKHN